MCPEPTHNCRDGGGPDERITIQVDPDRGYLHGGRLWDSKDFGQLSRCFEIGDFAMEGLVESFGLPRLVHLHGCNLVDEPERP